MALYGKSDAASNVSVVVCSTVQVTPNTDNRTALYGNTTADAFVSGTTKGIFGVDVAEARAARAGANTRVVTPGYQLRTVGSGGRAGRVQYETLVAVRLSTDAEDTVFADYKLVIDTQPSNDSANSTANEIATFTVVGNSVPTGATLSYVWQKYNGSAFANLSNAGAYSNTTTATLSVLANTASNGEVYRVRVASANGGANAIFSSNATLTITT
jgi:hypothetical protein